MPTESVIQRAFSSGEIAPALGARADLVTYQNGLTLCKNMVVQREGGLQNRAGTRFAGAAKLTTVTILIPFVFEGADQTFMLEFGNLYVRFWFHGARVVVTGVAAWNVATAYVVGDLVVDAAVNYYCILANTGNMPPNATFWAPLTGDIYEVPTPYVAADLVKLKYIQSADVITLTHKTYQPRDLQRVANTNWILNLVTTVPSVDPPTGVGVVAGGGAGARTFNYVVTTAKVDTFEESNASAIVTAAAAVPPTAAAPHVITWTAPTTGNVQEYYVYGDPYGNGIFGFLGTAEAVGLIFNDVGFAPDFTVTPPIPRTLFATVNNFPGTAAYYQQRRFFGNTNAEPERVFGSQIGAFSNFGISTPLQADDAIEFALASLTLNPVQFLVPLRRLLVLSDAGEWVMRGDTDGALTPTTLNAEQEGYVGAFECIRPVLVGNSLLYVQARGTILRALTFETEAAGLAGGDIAAGIDLSVLATHLFKGFTLTDLAFAQQPDSIVWACRSDGTLLGLTYLSEANVAAWHQHTTGASGRFERVAVIPDTAGNAVKAGEDMTWFVVQRTIGGSTVRYIEYLNSRVITETDGSDLFFVDSGLSFTGSLIATATGLSHLNGEIVAVIIDGVVAFDGDPDDTNAESFRVAGGVIQLPFPGTEVHVGLPIRFAEIETLELDVEGSSVRDKRKRVADLTALIEASHEGFLAGPDVDNLLEFTPEVWEVNEPGTPTFRSGQRELKLTGSFDEKGKIRIRHTQPLPLSILGIIPRFEIGE